MRLSRARAGLASLLLSLGAVAMGSLTASGSSAPPSHFIGGVAGTTITLEGPNQWTQSGSSFGHPWDQVVAEFKKVTGVTVHTDVLPLGHVLRRRVGPARRRYRSGPGLQPGELPAVHGRPAQQVPERAQPVRRR